MTDIIDQAKKLEIRQQAMALQAQRNRAKETEAPDEQDGVRYCLDCGDEISKQRLAARPEAVRCIECKGIQEYRNKHYA